MATVTLNLDLVSVHSGAKLFSITGSYNTADFCSLFSTTDLDQLGRETRGKPESLPKWWRPELNPVIPTLLPVVSLVGIFSNKKNSK